jgi:hypothetical protein
MGMVNRNLSFSIMQKIIFGSPILLAIAFQVHLIETNSNHLVNAASFIGCPSRDASSRRIGYQNSPERSLFASPLQNTPIVSSVVPNKERPNTTNPTAKSSFAFAKKINRRIIELGKKNDWSGILEIYQNDKEKFSYINYSTAMSQLGRIRSIRKDDARFEQLMLGIAEQLRNAATRKAWGAREMATVLHTVAKMQCKSQSANDLVGAILNDDNISVIIEKGEPQAISNSAWACAKLGVKCETLFTGINAGASYLVEQGTPQNIANTAWACATLGVKCPVLFKVINDNAAKIVEQGNPQEIANTAWACAKLGVECPLLFRSINAKASYLVQRGTPQGIANTAWACAKLGVECPNFFHAINDKSLYLGKQGKPQEIANMAWAAATLGVECPALFKAINENASNFVQQGTPQNVANTASACAKLGIECPALFKSINDNASSLVQHGGPQAIANTAWACATLGLECPELFSAIDANAMNLVTKGKPQEIVNTAWAFATLGVESPALFQAIDKHSSYLVEQGNTQDMANTVWACATLGVECPGLFTAVNSKISYLVQKGKPQEIANTAWAFATLGVECPTLFKGINERASYFVEEGAPQEIANTVWACSKLGIECPALFKAIDDNATNLINEGKLQELSSMALAFAQLGYRPTHFFDGLASRISSATTSFDSSNVQAIVNLCYSFAILDIASDYPTAFLILWNRVVQFKANELPEEGSFQLLQSFVMVSRVMDLPSPKELIQSFPQIIMTGANTLSRSQEEMSVLLHELGFVHEIEASPFPNRPFVRGLLAIDAACADRMIAIEFDGPSHYLRNVNDAHQEEEEEEQGRIENGPTQAKRRFLERLGWTVINIPYWEWDQAETKEGRQRLFAEKLL